MIQTRAQKGGQEGINGEWYEGGQFLPSTTLPKMHRANRRKGTGKVEIAPYTWEVPPSANHRSIYNMTAGTIARWAEWNEALEINASEQTLAYFGITRETAEALVEMWNSGERWIVTE